MKVAFFEVKDWEKEYLMDKLGGIQVAFFSEPLTEKNILVAKDFDIISVFVDSDVHEKSLHGFDHLKMIATRSTGFDHIDLDFCHKQNIMVCSVPTYGENTVAEHTFALILDLARKISQSIERTKRGDFSLEGLQGFDLKGKTLGVVGLGHIGQHVVRIARGFEMNVLTSDPKHGNATLEELLKNSDIITLHVPHNDQTHHLINLQNISMIKRGAYLINTARGGIIETAALVKALGDGILAGAGLDVLEEEVFLKEESHLLSEKFNKKYDLSTVLQNHMLLDQPNVIITPHNAFNSKEALERILETTMQNIQAFIKKKPINYV